MARTLTFHPPPPLQVEGCGSVKGVLGVGNSYTGVGRPPMAQVHNGDVGGHRDRTPNACFPKQERREEENGILREPSSCRVEGSSQGQSPSPSPEDGFLLGREDQDSERDREDGSTTPCKKRGRRKLERPTKCEFLARSRLARLSVGLLSVDLAAKAMCM